MRFFLLFFPTYNSPPSSPDCAQASLPGNIGGRQGNRLNSKIVLDIGVRGNDRNIIVHVCCVEFRMNSDLFDVFTYTLVVSMINSQSCVYGIWLKSSFDQTMTGAQNISLRNYRTATKMCLQFRISNRYQIWKLTTNRCLSPNYARCYFERGFRHQTAVGE